LPATQVHGWFYGERKLLVPGTFDDYLNPADSVILETDMHRAHLDIGPECPSPVPRGPEIIEPVNRFNARCRELGVPIIHIRTTVRPNNLDGHNDQAWRRLKPMTTGQPLPSSEGRTEGSPWVQFSVDVGPDDLILSGKKRLSPFIHTDLEFLLRRLGRNTVIITGLMTDCCCLNTAFDAANRDFRVVLLKDLTRGYSPDMEDAACKILSLHVALVLEAEELVQAWRG
jgi:nicotinamidase-related amidase